MRRNFIGKYMLTFSRNDPWKRKAQSVKGPIYIRRRTYIHTESCLRSIGTIIIFSVIVKVMNIVKVHAKSYCHNIYDYYSYLRI